MMQSLQLTQPFKQLTHSGVVFRIIATVTHVITAHRQSLTILSLSRRAYYKDMSSNLVIEKALRAASDFSCLDLSNAEVTKDQAKGYNQYLAAFDSVRFAGDM